MLNKNTPEYQENLAKLIEKANKSLTDRISILNELKNIQANISYITKQRDKANAELEKKEKTLSADRTKVLKEIISASNAQIENSQTYIESRKEALRISSKSLGILGTTINGMKALGKEILSQNKWLNEQQGYAKKSELSMGILSNQSSGFRLNIYKTALSTQQLGIGTKDLSLIQSTYSQNIGRSVKLSEEQLIAVSELARGTLLGAEGAAEFASNMENFGISAEGSAKFVNDVLNSSNKLGLNATKVIKTIGSNIKLMNRYNFKGGIKGLAKMAEITTKFKLEMQTVAGFADKLMTPEGAIEVASRLQVLGGAWAKLGNPFELMFRSRNDLEGLTKDIIEAASGTARWNEETKQFTIDPLELHRLREIANVTGMSADQLAIMAKESARFNKIQNEIGGNFNIKDKKYIATLAQFNSKTKNFEFTFINEDGENVTRNIKYMTDISANDIARIRDERESLKERALQALSFDDTLKNLKDTFKAVLLPGFKNFTTAFQHSIGSFQKWAIDSDFFTKLAKFGGEMGNIAGSMLNNPITSAIGAASAYLLGKSTQWYLRGIWLGAGFNTIADAGGVKTLASKVSRGLTGGYASSTASSFRPGQVGKANFFTRTGRRLRGGGIIGSGVLAGASSGYEEWETNKANGVGTSENIKRTALVGGLTGLGAYGGAALGAELGSVVPVIGTIIGGIAGAYLGHLAAKGADNAIYGDNKHNDFISRPGEQTQSFNSKDTIIGAKSNGPIDKMLSGSANSNGNMNVNFNKALEINGNIDIHSDGKTAKIDLDNPLLIRNFSKLIQEELSKAINGGKNSSNPVLVN